MSAATSITAASLANSLGVSDCPPMKIQRRAPLMLVPMDGTSTATRPANASRLKGSASLRYQP